MNPLISIIVPNYNHYSYLQQRLDSVLNQTYTNFEVILLDDCSTDNSQELLSEYAKKPNVSHFIINKQNSGSPFKQWQKGIELANGDYIWVAESDDYCDATFLEKIMQLFNEDKNLGIAYSQTIDVNEKEKTLLHRIEYTQQFKPNIWENNFVISGKEFVEKYLKVKNVIPNASAVVFKKSLIKECTFSNQILDMKMCGDWFLWIKLCISPTNIGFISKPLNFFRQHEGVSRNHINKNLKTTRLMEEANIRKYLVTHNSPSQDLEIKNLYKRWFELTSFSEIFTKQFYEIKMPYSSCFSYLKRFLLFKINE